MDAKKLHTLSAKANAWFVQHNGAMNLVLIAGAVGLIFIALLPAKYAPFKAFMIGYAILPLPY